MKKVLLGVIGLAALGTAQASAADLAPRTYTKAPAMIAAVYDWSGFYVGLNGGGGWSHNCWTNTVAGGVATGVSEGCHDASGGMVGGQVGYRWQSSNFVFGVEGQGDWANFKGSNVSTAVLPAPLLGITNQSKIDAIGLITGQVGYAWNNVLWYVKGGAGVAHDKYTGFTAGGLVLDSGDQTRWGGTVGTGVEIGFAPNWTVGVEYDHMFLGSQSQNLTTPVGVVTRTDSIKSDLDIASVRVNYRWGGPVVAKY